MSYNAFLKDVKDFCLFPYGEEILVWQYQFTPNSNTYHLYLTDVITPKDGTKFHLEILKKDEFLTRVIIVGQEIMNEDYQKQILILTKQLFFSF